MQQRLSLICLAVLINSGCAHGPKVTACVSNPHIGGFNCYDENTGQASILPYDASDKYVAFSPSDAQALINYCGSPAAAAGPKPTAEQIIAFIQNQ